jgi:hypothetical protein
VKHLDLKLVELAQHGPPEAAHVIAVIEDGEADLEGYCLGGVALVKHQPGGRRDEADHEEVVREAAALADRLDDLLIHLLGQILPPSILEELNCPRASLYAVVKVIVCASVPPALKVVELNHEEGKLDNPGDVPLQPGFVREKEQHGVAHEQNGCDGADVPHALGGHSRPTAPHASLPGQGEQG